MILVKHTRKSRFSSFSSEKKIGFQRTTFHFTSKFFVFHFRKSFFSKHFNWLCLSFLSRSLFNKKNLSPFLLWYPMEIKNFKWIRFNRIQFCFLSFCHWFLMSLYILFRFSWDDDKDDKEKFELYSHSF